ncbi:MAG: von Willebrand factor type A domain-containing protein, partial [Clostridia bacterium]|nr:von Willebrand factor type A domain-containing protein [Clostridia bacterium]
MNYKKQQSCRVLTALLTILLCLSLLVSCAEAPSGSDLGDGGTGGINGGNSAPNAAPEYSNKGDESFMPDGDGDTFRENDFLSVADKPVSTFSSDVDTASYAYFRKLVSGGMPFERIRDAYGANIRTEEMLNYFSYRYTAPKEGEPFGVYTEIAPCPWNEENALLMMNLTAEIAEPKEGGNNLVFLIDV